jgi:AraC-like DNA-binding protein
MPRVDRQNTSRYWRGLGLSGLSMLEADFTTHEYAAHRHDEFVIAVTEAGGAFIKTSSETIEVCPGVLFVSNPAELQSTWMGRSARWRYRSFYLSDAALSDVVRHVGFDGTASFQGGAVRDAELCEALVDLHQGLAAGRDSLEEMELLISALGRLFVRHGDHHRPVEIELPKRGALDRVIQCMRESFRDRLELDDLAGVAGLTIFQLIEMFRRVTGVTPHAFLIQVRLNAARQHLKRGASLAEAATANGFYDQSALTKHFKRAYGITPGQFVSAMCARPGGWPMSLRDERSRSRAGNNA